MKGKGTDDRALVCTRVRASFAVVQRPQFVFVNSVRRRRAVDIVDHGDLEGMSKAGEVGIDGEIQMVDVRNQKECKGQMEAREGSAPQNNQQINTPYYHQERRKKDIVQL